MKKNFALIIVEIDEVLIRGEKIVFFLEQERKCSKKNILNFTQKHLN